MAGRRLLLLGGDAREAEAARQWTRLGHAVRVLGSGGSGPAAARRDCAWAEAVVGPVLGTNAAGDAVAAAGAEIPLSAELLGACARGTPWLIGRAGPWLREATATAGLPLQTYADRDEFATLNAVPTAEGAIGEATRLAGRTLWGGAALVIGGGRCAQALVCRLRAWGCQVTLCTRDPLERARAAAAGAEAAGLDGLTEAARQADFVFNTVPAPVLGPGILAALPEGAVVADLASAPGGTDFAAAEALGVRAALLPAIPGRLYPKTAGRILAAVVLGLLAGEGELDVRVQ